MGSVPLASQLGEARVWGVVRKGSNLPRAVLNRSCLLPVLGMVPAGQLTPFLFSFESRPAQPWEASVWARPEAAPHLIARSHLSSPSYGTCRLFCVTAIYLPVLFRLLVSKLLQNT